METASADHKSRAELTDHFNGSIRAVLPQPDLVNDRCMHSTVTTAAGPRGHHLAPLRLIGASGASAGVTVAGVRFVVIKTDHHPFRGTLTLSEKRAATRPYCPVELLVMLAATRGEMIASSWHEVAHLMRA